MAWLDAQIRDRWADASLGQVWAILGGPDDPVTFDAHRTTRAHYEEAPALE